MDDFIDKVAWGLNVGLLATASATRARAGWSSTAPATSSRSSDYLRPTRCRRRSGTRPTADLTAPNIAQQRSGSAPACAATLDERGDDGRGCGAVSAERSSSTTCRACRARLRRPAPRPASCCCASTTPPPRARWLGDVAARLTTADARPARRGGQRRADGRASAARPAGDAVAQLPATSSPTGMATRAPQPVLGDVDESAPERWEWGGPATPTRRTLLLLLYAQRRGGAGRRSSASTPARARAGSRIAAPARAPRPRRPRALRLPRRHLAAAHRGARRSTAPARDDRARRRVRARLPERVRPLHRPAARSTAADDPRACCRRDVEGTGAPTSAATAATSCCASWSRTCAAFWRFVDAAARADGEPTRRAESARGEDGRPLAERRAARAGARRRRPGRSPSANDFALPRATTRAACAARSARTSAARTRATRSIPTPGIARSLGGRQAPPAAAARPRVRAAGCRSSEALARRRRRRRARPATSSCLNANIAPPVRVRPAHLGEQPEVRGPLRRARPARRPSRRPAATFSMPADAGPPARDRRAAVRDGARRRLLLPARACARCATWRRCCTRDGATPPRTSRRRSARSASTLFISWRSRDSSQYIRLPRAALVAERPVLGDAVPRVVGEHARERDLLGRVERLPRDAQHRGRHARRQPRRPQHGVVLDRHQERVGLHLQQDVELDVLLRPASPPSRRAGSCPAGAAAGAARACAPFSRGWNEYCIACPSPSR